MKNTKKAFTLVELIVVITILAVLGTIAFVSFGSYSADARNTKRTSDVKGIQSKISTSVTEGMSLLAMVTSDNTKELATPSIQGTASTAGTDYNAGAVNYAVVGVKAEDFKDPSNDEDYIVGATTRLGGKFEVTASLEDGAGNRVAKVVGDYSPRAETTVAVTSTGTKGTIPDADIGKLKVGDSNGTVKIVKVSKDFKTVTFDGNFATGNFTVAAEVGGLVKDADDTASTNPVIEGSTTARPY